MQLHCFRLRLRQVLQVVMVEVRMACRARQVGQALQVCRDGSVDVFGDVGGVVVMVVVVV